MIQTTQPSFLDSIGGWPNLLQGLGSAVVGGLVAAITAYAVVRLTHRSDRRLATEVEGRSAARAIVAAAAKTPRDLQAWGSSADKPPRGAQAGHPTFGSPDSTSSTALMAETCVLTSILQRQLQTVQTSSWMRSTR
jgi:hypothetical protein